MNVPDCISPVVGFRVWQWDATGLRSLNGEKWFAHQPLSAMCRADACGSISGLSKANHNPDELPCFKCTCGAYAARTMEHLNQCGYQRFGVHGEVYLWGKVVEHERGWRAQFAYPKALFLAVDKIPFSLSEINSRLKTLTEFGTNVFLQRDCERVALWIHGSGFDAAGLDYLVKTRKEYYVRRQQDRTLKKGTRVAVLGHGIAVVQQTDDKEALVVLWNRHVLRIARKDIVLNQQNMRWECEATKARGSVMRVGIYARVSTLIGQSPEMQLTELREYASRRGWEIFSEYVDSGISGSKESRPELNRLMSDAHQRKIDAVLVWKVDRFGRSLKHLVNALADLDAYGVAFVSLRDNLDLSTPSGRLMFQIIGAMAEFERSLIQERVRAGLRNAILKGKTLGRPRRIVNGDQMARLREQGASLREIAKAVGASPGTVRTRLLCG